MPGLALSPGYTWSTNAGTLAAFMELGLQWQMTDICHQRSESWFSWGLGWGISWRLCNLLADAFSHWRWQRSLQGMGILLVRAMLIGVSAVSSLPAFVDNTEFPDTRNDRHALPDNSHTTMCDLAGFTKHNSSLGRRHFTKPAIENSVLSDVRTLWVYVWIPMYSCMYWVCMYVFEYLCIQRGCCFFISYDWSNLPIMSLPTGLQEKINLECSSVWWLYPALELIRKFFKFGGPGGLVG